MSEKILNGNKNGMLVLLVGLLLYAADIAAIVWAGLQTEEAPSALSIAVLVVAIVFACTGWILLCGLKVLKPQEALVLTLFGNCVGTLKENGFYWVNPFCVGVNPASKTRLNHRQPDRDRNRRNMENRGHRKSSFQCGKLQGIFVAAV